MGTLHCQGAALSLDDRLLTHLQIVVVQKFRRGESFLMTWLHDRDAIEGRGSLWMTPGTPIVFRFSGSRIPTIDEAWLQRLAASAASSTGLVVMGQNGHPIPLPSIRGRLVETRPASR
jgi:hypothetical protein